MNIVNGVSSNHKNKLKSSSETLSSTDSTLESHLSSEDIPKMELLKINYVNMHKDSITGNLSHSRNDNNQNNSVMTKFAIHKKLPGKSLETLDHRELRKTTTTVSVTTNNSGVKSWDFLQNKRAIPTTNDDKIPTSNRNSSICDQTLDRTVNTNCSEKSHSWDYRPKSTPGAKSRANRIAKIEKIDCEHLQCGKKINEKPCSDVTKINQIFEKAKMDMPKYQTDIHIEQQQQRPLEIVANRRSFSPNTKKDEKIKRLSDNSQNYCDCQYKTKTSSAAQLIPTEQLSRLSFVSTSSSSGHGSSGTASNSSSLGQDFRSRIPKPLKSIQGCTEPLNESNEMLNKKIKQLFEMSSSSSEHDELSKKSNAVNAKKSENDKLSRKTSDSKKTHHSKMDRIHIRKKRQPLLIMNQTTENCSNKNDLNHLHKFGKSCGYQNCKFDDCPMSSSGPVSPSSSCVAIERDRVEQKFKDDAIKQNNIRNSEKSSDGKYSLIIRTSKTYENDDVQQNKPSKKTYVHINQELDKHAVRQEEKAQEQRKLNENKELNELRKKYGSDTVNEEENHHFYENSNDEKIKIDYQTKSQKDNKLNDYCENKELDGKPETIALNDENFNNVKLSQGDPNDVQNFSNKNLIKVTTDELLSTSVLNNTITKNSQHQQNNIDVALKNNENRKYNNLKANNQTIPVNILPLPLSLSTLPIMQTPSLLSSPLQPPLSPTVSSASSSNNSVKIFIRNASLSNYSISSCGDTNSLSDSDKDCGYYDEVAGSSSVILSSSSTDDDDNSRERGPINFNNANSMDTLDKIRSFDNCHQHHGNSESTTKVSPTTLSPISITSPMASVFPSKLGCDGGIFWNNCYFYDELYCSNCSSVPCDDDNCSYFDVDPPPTPAQLPQNSKIVYKKKSSKKTDVIHELRPRSMDGVIDSGVSLNGDTSSSPDSDHMQNQQDSDTRRLKRGHVLSELLETERIYVTEMSSILKGYRDQMQSEEMVHLVPASLQGKEDILFGNLFELYKFHSEVFLKDLENCISTTELVALCFVQRRDTFYRLYSFYCQNIPRSERLRETLVDTHLFLQECQKRLGHKLPLAAYLLKPVQRITKYQLLLKDLLRFSDSGSCTKELQKALDCMLIVLKCVNDSMHQVAITGFPSDLSQQGDLLLQDSFQVWTESKKDIRLRLKPQQRHIFLYQKAMLFCKQTSKTGHNKSTYQYKNYLKMSQIGLTESVRGDPKRFEVWLQGRQEVHTLQAPNVDIKNKWVAEIKRVLLNQLEELKGEKIKQYGLNNRGLRQTTSWDTPIIGLISTPQRTMSCDTSSESNRNSNTSTDSFCPPQTPGINSLSSDKESTDACGWSSDYSNSEDELSMIEDNSAPGSKYVALADYCAMGHSEVSMKEGENVELLKVGCAGWWFVRILDSNAEGWTPAAYLGPPHKKTSRCSSRNQDRMNI